MNIQLQRLLLSTLALALTCISGSLFAGEKTDIPNPANLRLLVLSDTHVTSSVSKAGRIRAILEKVNNQTIPGVDMVFVTGDIVSNVYGDYTPENQDKSDNRMERAVNVFSVLEVPYHWAMGNHDHKIASYRDSDAPWPREEILSMWEFWRATTGQEPYYAVNQDGWRFIVLNSFGGRHIDRHFEPEQLKWLDGQLKDGLPSILFFHHPMETDTDLVWCKPLQATTPQREPEFYALLKQYQKSVKGIFVGHGHRFVKDKLFNTIPVYETASFGEGKDDSFNIVDIDSDSATITVIHGPDFVQSNSGASN